MFDSARPPFRSAPRQPLAPLLIAAAGAHQTSNAGPFLFVKRTTQSRVRSLTHTDIQMAPVKCARVQLPRVCEHPHASQLTTLAPHSPLPLCTLTTDIQLAPVKCAIEAATDAACGGDYTLWIVGEQVRLCDGRMAV